MADQGQGSVTADKEHISKVLHSIADAFKSQLRAPLLKTPADVGLTYEDVTFLALDGVPLQAWFIPCEESNKLIICNHPRGFNRYGQPSNQEPWKSMLAKAGNDIEVDFTKDYRILHEAGYNVLTYDLRNHGHSGMSNGIVTNGRFESRDVVGAMRYVRSRDDLASMTTGLFSRCLGCSSTIFALSRYAKEFVGVRCLVGAQPLSPRFYYERMLTLSGIPVECMSELDHLVRLATSFGFD